MSRTIPRRLMLLSWVAALRDDADEFVRDVDDLFRRLAVEVLAHRLAVERHPAHDVLGGAGLDHQAIADLAVDLHDDGYGLVTREFRIILRPGFEMDRGGMAELAPELLDDKGRERREHQHVTLDGEAAKLEIGRA